MRIASYIGLRFLRSPRQTRSVTLVTLISAGGVMLGVTALIVTVSVMNGFRENLFLAVTGTMAHARVLPPRGELDAQALADLRARLNALPDVVATAPYFSRQGFVRAHGQYRAVVLRGVDPAAEAVVSDLPRFVRVEDADGREVRPPPAAVLAALAWPPPEGESTGILLGRPLALALGLRTGDTLELISTVQRMTPIGPVPLIKRFRLAGTIETGLGGIDEVSAYANLEIARRLYRVHDGAGGVAVRVRHPQELTPGTLEAAVPGYRVRTWSEENRNIFQVMQLEKAGLFLILTLIIVVGFFNIISSLVMLVLEKRKAIAVLKSLGASNRLVRRVFFMQGVWIGLVGTLSGLGLGLLACWALATFDLIPLPPGVFPLVQRLPVRIEVVDLALITACSFGICLLVTLYPATAAARTHPVENLRNE